MIRKNKNINNKEVNNTEINSLVIIKKDSLITRFLDYFDKLFMRNTKERYKAEVYKVINIKNY